MKKGLTILTSAICLTTLMSCNNNKVKSIKIQTLPYILSEKLYPLDVLVEGNGVYSPDYTLTCDDANVDIFSNHYFMYNTSVTESKEITFTAIAKEDKTVKSTFKVNVISNSITKDVLVNKAAEGDTTLNTKMSSRTERKLNLETDHGEEDVGYGFDGKKAAVLPVTKTLYKLTQNDAQDKTTAQIQVTIGVKPAMIKTLYIPNKEKIETNLNEYAANPELYNYQCFDNDGYYGYYAQEVSLEKPLITKFYAFKDGLLTNYSYFEDYTCYAYLNLTPHWPE